MIREQRFYSGKVRLPNPSIEHDPHLNLLTILLSWGDPSAVDFTRENIKHSLLSHNESTEVTRIGKHVEPISDELPKLQQAFQNVNDLINKNFNSIEFSAAIEVLAVKKVNRCLYWSQCGSPSLYLARKGNLFPISSHWSFAQQFHQMAPVITSGLGLEDSVSIQSGVLRWIEGDELFVISNHRNTPNLYLPKDITLENLALAMASEDDSASFWIASLNID